MLLVVDASGSMAARRRMEAVKTAALSLLLDAYQRRDKVGLITFRGAEADLALPPTSSVDVAARRLRELPSGGRTPLAEGLLCAAETLRPGADPGPAAAAAAGRWSPTAGPPTGPTPCGRSRQVADQLRRDRRRVGGDRLRDRPVHAWGWPRELSVRLGAQHVPVAEVGAGQVLAAVRPDRRRPRPTGRARPDARGSGRGQSPTTG